MCSNWIIPFIAGVFVGQEFKEIPKVRPYLEAGMRKLVRVGKEIYDNAQEHNVSSSDADNNDTDIVTEQNKNVKYHNQENEGTYHRHSVVHNEPEINTLQSIRRWWNPQVL